MRGCEFYVDNARLEMLGGQIHIHSVDVPEQAEGEPLIIDGVLCAYDGRRYPAHTPQRLLAAAVS